MAHYRFIGGPGDGRAYEVSETETSVEIEIRTPPPSMAMAEPRSTPFEKFAYTRRSLRTPDGELYYFAPKDWTDQRALQHVFQFEGDAVTPERKGEPLVERLAVSMAIGNNGGQWATHYTEGQKFLWRTRAANLIADLKRELEKI